MIKRNVRESKRAVALNVAPRSSLLPRGKRKISGSLAEKSVAESSTRRSWPFMSGCCTVASADNFFPGVKSLSSPPRFPKKGDRTRIGGGKNALRGVGKFYVVGRVRGCRGSPPRTRPKAFARRRYNFNHSSTKQLSLLLSFPLFLSDTLMEHVEKMRHME